MAQKIIQTWKHIKTGKIITSVGTVDHSIGETRVFLLKSQMNLLKSGWEMIKEETEEVPGKGPICLGNLMCMNN